MVNLPTVKGCSELIFRPGGWVLSMHCSHPCMQALVACRRGEEEGAVALYRLLLERAGEERAAEHLQVS